MNWIVIVFSISLAPVALSLILEQLSLFCHSISHSAISFVLGYSLSFSTPDLLPLLYYSIRAALYLFVATRPRHLPFPVISRHVHRMPVQSGLPTLSASSRSSRSSYEHDLRRRRVQDDSSANSATHVAPHSQVTLQGYTQQKFRAGCPPLHILPLQSIIVPYDHESSVALRGLLPGIRNALKSHQVQPEDECDPICLVYRPIPDELPTVENITVYVQAIWDDNSPLQWLNAVKAIQAILQSHPGTSNIKVEIISWQLTAPRNIEALEESHPLVAAWPQIRPQVHVILGQSPVVATSWLTILVLRQGYNPPGSWLGGPYSTSVVLRIIMSYDVDPWQWIEQEHNIKELLIQRGFADIDVEFERGENVRMVFPLSEPRDTPKSGDIIDGPYNVSVGMGADFGPARNLFQAPEKPVAGPCGTIGGYLTVTGPNGTSRKMGLTNHHVIREVFEGFIYTTAPDGQAIKGEILGNSVLTCKPPIQSVCRTPLNLNRDRSTRHGSRVCRYGG